jgi:hypothetical protein
MKRLLQLVLVMAVAMLAPLTVAAQQKRWGAESEQARARAEANSNTNQHHWGPAQPSNVAERRPHRYHRHHHHRRDLDRDHDRFRHDRDHDHDRH